MPYGRITPKQQEILLLPFIHIWKHWRKMDISAEMQRNHVRLRLLMTILIWSAERL